MEHNEVCEWHIQFRNLISRSYFLIDCSKSQGRNVNNFRDQYINRLSFQRKDTSITGNISSYQTQTRT